MRKITEQATNAFFNNEKFSRDNTQVVIESGNAMLTLHGSVIAIKSPSGRVVISNCGHTTRTTTERLNGVLGHLGVGRIYTQNSQQKWKNGENFPHNQYIEVN